MQCFWFDSMFEIRKQNVNMTNQFCVVTGDCTCPTHFKPTQATLVGVWLVFGGVCLPHVVLLWGFWLNFASLLITAAFAHINSKYSLVPKSKTHTHKRLHYHTIGICINVGDHSKIAEQNIWKPIKWKYLRLVLGSEGQEKRKTIPSEERIWFINTQRG